MAASGWGYLIRKMPELHKLRVELLRTRNFFCQPLAQDKAFVPLSVQVTAGAESLKPAVFPLKLLNSGP